MWELYNGTSCTSTITSGFYYYSGSTAATTTCTQTYYASQAQYVGQMYNCAQATTTSDYGGALYNNYNSRESQSAWLARQRIEQAAQLQKHSKEVRERAIELLVSHLTPEQRETFERKKWFVVEGGRSKRRYRIHANDNVAANIEILDGERTTQRLCGHCEIAKVPLGDHVLAQKIMLEADEDAFLRIANRHAA